MSSHGHEFSDRLSPFLVKELRQGLRGKIYLALFLSLITALTVYSLSFVSATDGDASRTETGMFNAIIFVALAILLPLNGINAMSEEKRSRKVELVMLSRIRARGVIAGKWAVGAMQSATLAAVIAPFIVLRYFAGGVEMVEDLIFLGFSLFTGLAFSAVTLCVSAFLAEGLPVISGLLRGVIVLGALFGGLSLAGNLAFAHGSISSELLPMMWTALAVLVLGAPLVLEIAASRLAPEAENHDGVIRIMGVAAGLIAGTTLYLATTPTGHSGSTTDIVISVITTFTGAIALIAVAFTLFSDALPQIPYRTPTDRFGAIGRRFGAIFLTPGWRSGFAFLLLLLAAITPLLYAFWENATDRAEIALGFAQFWSALLWPLVCFSALNLSPARRFGIWLLCQVAGGVLAIFAHTQRWFEKSLFDFVPTTGLFNLNHNLTSTTAVLGVGLTVVGVTTSAILGLRRHHEAAVVARASRGA